MRPALREFIASKHLDDRVEMVGYVDNPFPFVESADIVLMCSQCEAFARAVLEGMMLGKPIVGSRSGGTVEAVRDHFNGFLYTPGDVRDLADKVRYLAENLEYAASSEKTGENGRSTHLRRRSSLVAYLTSFRRLEVRPTCVSGAQRRRETGRSSREFRGKVEEIAALQADTIAFISSRSLALEIARWRSLAGLSFRPLRAYPY